MHVNVRHCSATSTWSATCYVSARRAPRPISCRSPSCRSAPASRASLRTRSSANRCATTRTGRSRRPWKSLSKVGARGRNRCATYVKSCVVLGWWRFYDERLIKIVTLADSFLCWWAGLLFTRCLTWCLVVRGYLWSLLRLEPFDFESLIYEVSCILLAVKDAQWNL